MPNNDSEGTLVLLVQLEECYSIRRIVAHPQRATDEGMFNILWDDLRPNAVRHLADFAIGTYLSPDYSNPYGWQHYYSGILHLKLEQAESAVKVLRKVKRGLEQRERDEGYPQDFATYLFRVAAVLGIRTYYLRSSEKRKAMSGKTFYQADGSDVRRWIQEQVKQFCKPVTDDE